MHKLWKWVGDSSLLLVFLLLFLVCLLGQSLSGVASYNGTRSAHGLAPIGCWQYVRTGNFLEGMFSNWQAAILQLGTLIVFAVFLRAKGAAHSIKPGKHVKQLRSKIGSRQENLNANWFYRNSLSIAFGVLFLASFAIHLLAATAAENEQRALFHQAPFSVAAFAVSSRFWFETMQTWEAEFMAIALYIFLSIFLRQAGSPESKPVEAKNETTGETNK